MIEFSLDIFLLRVNIHLFFTTKGVPLVEFTIFCKVALKGDPCHQFGDQAGEKTGVCQHDGWGIIGMGAISGNLESHFPEGCFVRIDEEGLYKEIWYVPEPHGKTSLEEKRHIYRIIGSRFINLPPDPKVPAVCVVPVLLEERERLKTH